MSDATHNSRGLFRRFLREHVAPYWLLQAQIAVCVLVQVALELADPLILRAVIDHAIGDGDSELLVLLCALLAGSLLFRVAFRIVSTWLYSYGGLRVLFDLRRRAYERVQDLSPYELSGERRGDVLARLTSDVDVLQRAAVYTIVHGAQHVLVIAGVWTVLVLLDAQLAGVLALLYPALAALLWLLNRSLRNESEAARESVGRLYEFLDERIGAVRLIQQFRRQRAQLKQLVSISRAWIRSHLRLSVLASLQVSLADVMLSAAPILVFLFGGARVLEGTLSIGALIAFYTLAGRLHRPVSLLIDINVELHSARAALRRVYELIDQDGGLREPVPPHDPPQVRGEFVLERVDFRWGEQRVLSDVSLRIAPGERIAIVGASGSGKSTLAALVSRFLDPSGGAVRLDGLDLRRWPLARLRRAVGVAPQEPQLFHTSLRDNLLLAAPHASAAQLREVLELVQLGAFVDASAAGLDTPVGESGLRLSGGERQRVALARALLARPEVLVLDEATSALDPRTERLVLDAVVERMRGRTLIMVAHRLTSIQDCDRILVLEGGRLVESGAHVELYARGGVYRELYDQQLRASP